MSTVKRAEHFARDAFRGSFRRPRGGFYLSARTRAARLCAGSSAGFQGRPWRKDRESFDCQHEETCVSHGGDVTRKTVSLNCVPTQVCTQLFLFPLPLPLSTGARCLARLIGGTRCCLSSRPLSNWSTPSVTPWRGDKREKGRRVKGVNLAGTGFFWFFVTIFYPSPCRTFVRNFNRRGEVWFCVARKRC